MKRFLIAVAIFLGALIAAAALLWSSRKTVACYFLTKGLHVPVSMGSLDISTGQANIAKFWIGNPPLSRTKTAFSSETIDINSTFKQLIGNPLTIDRIALNQVFIGVEMYNAKTKDNNWNHIASQDQGSAAKGRDYLIKTLVLDNLTVRVTQPNGSSKTYPTIKHMEFHNISSDTGFPIDEIEKAIFNMVIKDLIRQLNLDQLLEQFNVPAAPLKLLPNLFGSDAP